MKTCNKCGIEKELTEFHKRKDGHAYTCKMCCSVYMKQHYIANKQYYLDEAKKGKANTALWLKDYKSKLKCETCGENHPACLDFHHIDRTTKLFTISVAERHSREDAMAEIAKCRVLCSNCHRKLHYDEGS